MSVYKETSVYDTEVSNRRSDIIKYTSNHLGFFNGKQVWKDTPIAFLFAEEKSDGFWRLQTEDAHLKKRMKPRVWNARSPWHLTGRSSTTCIFRRWFSSTRNVHQTIRRILARGASECSFVRHKVQIAFQNRFSGKNGRKAIHIEKKMMPLWANQTLTSSVKLHVGARLIWL